MRARPVYCREQSGVWDTAGIARAWAHGALCSWIGNHAKDGDVYAIYKHGRHYYTFTEFEPAVDTLKEAEAQGLCRRFPALDAAIAYGELVG